MAKRNITIKQLENGCFDVLYNEKRTGDLSFDEMLGLIAAITMPQKRPCLHWLKTEEWHEEEARQNNHNLYNWKQRVITAMMMIYHFRLWQQ